MAKLGNLLYTLVYKFGVLAMSQFGDVAETWPDGNLLHKYLRKQCIQK